MSSPFDTFAVDQMTVYSVGATDVYGNPTVALKGVINCEYRQGGSMQRDDNGDQFVPMSTFYPVETDFSVVVGDYVALGDTSADDYQAAKGKRVRKVSRAGQSYFGWDDAVVVYTG